MKKLLAALIAVAIMSSVIVPGFAQEKGKKRGQSPVMAMLKDLDLSAEQKAKIEAVAREVDPKLQEINKALNEVLTKEQQAAKARVTKENREGNVKGKDAAAAVAAAVKMTDEQKAKSAEIEKKRAEVLAGLRKHLSGVLSEEQIAKVPQLAARKGKKKDA